MTTINAIQAKQISFTAKQDNKKPSIKSVAAPAALAGIIGSGIAHVTGPRQFVLFDPKGDIEGLITKDMDEAAKNTIKQAIDDFNKIGNPAVKDLSSAMGRENFFRLQDLDLELYASENRKELRAAQKQFDEFLDSGVVAGKTLRAIFEDYRAQIREPAETLLEAIKPFNPRKLAPARIALGLGTGLALGGLAAAAYQKAKAQ